MVIRLQTASGSAFFKIFYLILIMALLKKQRLYRKIIFKIYSVMMVQLKILP